jgi:hypothetical protein
MQTFDLTSADVGTVIANTPGSMTPIEAVGRGSSGKFSLSDPTTILSRGFSQPLVSIGVDCRRAPFSRYRKPTCSARRFPSPRCRSTKSRLVAPGA